MSQNKVCLETGAMTETVLCPEHLSQTIESSREHGADVIVMDDADDGDVCEFCAD